MTASSTENPYVCPDQSEPTNSTFTFVIDDAVGDVSPNSTASIFSECPNLPQTYEVTFQGSSYKNCAGR